MPQPPSFPPQRPPAPNRTLPVRPAGRPQILQGYFPGGFSRIVQAQRWIGAAQPPGTAQPNAGSATQLPSHLSNFQGRASGKPLPEPVRQKMETFFNADFSDVRIHVGPEAPAIGALAFTLGSSLYFAPGQYDPGTPYGQRLLGHELTHVVQQRAGRVRNPFGSGVAVVQDPLMEAEAERMGIRVASMPMPAQAKPDPARGAVRNPVPVKSVQAKPDFRVVTSSNGDTRRIRIAAGGREVGSVEVLNADRDAVRVVNLKVDPDHRKLGAGVQLMREAAREGMRMGKARVTLESQDNGSGKLTRWYERMGFQ
ncbi:MAG TPA: GNAT family N-acetyltransferase, partial [Thermoanaerobaculia bacterium]|nr:GNAT family N-acetyltransferase [Thermoanaerobaculia bacterium]